MSTEPTKTTPRRTRGKSLLPAPVGIESIDAATELANNPKALEIAQKLLGVGKERDHWKRLADSRQETLQERNAEIQKLKEQHDADLKERLALANQRDEARVERDDYKRSVDALTTQLDNALAERNAAQQGAERLQVERDQWKATAERFQTSTNNLGGMLKAQGRDEEYHGIEADLPGGLLSSLPNPFRWLLRWIGGAK